MLNIVKKFFGKILCRFGYHYAVLNNGSNVASGSHCTRKGCEHKTDPIVWPDE